MIEKRLNVLMLEDTKTDEVLVKRQLLIAAPNCIISVARNKADFMEKLEWSVPDLIISDYNLPDMNGLEALLYVREKFALLPFIFVTGALNSEEQAAEAILHGASGYVLKDNLKQLPEKIIEVLHRTEAQNATALEAERRRREACLSIQKVMAMIGKAPFFDGKDQINALLGEVLETIDT